MKGKPYNDSIGHVQERACTCAHTCALEGMCKIIDRHSPHKVCRHQCVWPEVAARAVLGSSAKVVKNEATLTETQARLASGWANDIHHGPLGYKSLKGQRADWPLPSAFSLMECLTKEAATATELHFASV